MTYTAPGYRGIQSVRYATSAQKLSMTAEADGAVVTVSGTPTYEVFRNGSDTAITSGNATNTSNVLSASIDCTDTGDYPLERGYTIRFAFSDGTTTWKRDVMFDVVRTPTDDDIPFTLNDLRGLHTRVDAMLTQASQGSDGNSRYVIPAWEWVRNKLETVNLQPDAVRRESVVLMLRYRVGFVYMQANQQSPGDLHEVLWKAWEAENDKLLADLVAHYKPNDGLTTEKMRGLSQPVLLTGPARPEGVTSWMLRRMT